MINKIYDLLECDVFLSIAALFIAVIVIIVLIDKPLPAWIHPLLFYVQVSGAGVQFLHLA